MSDNNAVGKLDERNNLTVIKDGKEFAWLSGILSADNQKILLELITRSEGNKLCAATI